MAAVSNVILLCVVGLSALALATTRENRLPQYTVVPSGGYATVSYQAVRGGTTVRYEANIHVWDSSAGMF